MTTPITTTPTPTSGACTDTIRGGTPLLPAGTLMLPGRIAAAGSDVYVAAGFGGQPATGSRIVRCASTGCTPTSPMFGAPRAMGREIGLLTLGTHVYWTERSLGATSSLGQTELFRAELDGSNPTKIYAMPATATGGIGPEIGIAGKKLVLAVGAQTSGYPNLSSLVTIDTDTLAATTVPDTSFDPLYAWHVKLGASGSRVAWYLESMGALRPASDGKVHVLDLGGGPGEATAKIDGVSSLSLGTNSLAVVSWTSTARNDFSCALGSCATPKPITGLVGVASTVSADQLYFVKDRGACPGSTVHDFALVRCSLASAVAGTCTSPEVLSAGWFWANARQMVVSGNTVVAWGNAPTNVVRVTLP